MTPVRGAEAARNAWLHSWCGCALSCHSTVMVPGLLPTAVRRVIDTGSWSASYNTLTSRPAAPDGDSVEGYATKHAVRGWAGPPNGTSSTTSRGLVPVPASWSTTCAVVSATPTAHEVEVLRPHPERSDVASPAQ